MTRPLPLDRAAVASAPLLRELSERWSPRAFDPNRIVTDAELAALLEAARWAPSAYNTQPRRFIVARAGTPGFARVHAGLAPRNQLWAAAASVLIVNIAVQGDERADTHRWAEYDLGQAVAHLSVQAQAMGLHTHQVGGIHADALVAAFALPARWEPLSITVIGALADPDALPEPLRTWEAKPRERMPLAEMVIDA